MRIDCTEYEEVVNPKFYTNPSNNGNRSWVGVDKIATRTAELKVNHSHYCAMVSLC